MMKMCKRCIKAALRLILKRNIEDIKRQIDEAEVVSFDLFDTLVYRESGKPESVFKLISDEHEGFYKKRLLAERRARKEIPSEITIDDIYDRIEGIEKKELELLQKKEIDTELSVSRIREEGRMLYEYALLTKKTIVITSDMYLGEGILTRILEKNGYSSWDKLYVSSAYGMIKKKGLFKAVIKDYEGKKILHIGDDSVSDWASARKLRVEAAVL